MLSHFETNILRNLKWSPLSQLIYLLSPGMVICLFTPQIHQLTWTVFPCSVKGNSFLTLTVFRLWPYHYFSVCSYTFYYWSQNYSSPFLNPSILFDLVTSCGSGFQRQFFAFARAVTKCLMLKDENTLSHLWCLKRRKRPQDLSAYYTV